MMVMKRYVLFIFALVFAVNTVSLSAYAGACQMDTPQATAAQPSADMPDCHKKMAQEQKKNSTHCKGVCFCQHVLLNSHFLTAPDVVMAAFYSKERYTPAVDMTGVTIESAPLLRPPILIS